MDLYVMIKSTHEPNLLGGYILNYIKTRSIQYNYVHTYSYNIVKFSILEDAEVSPKKICNYVCP